MGQTLNSWQEIASYVGKGLRTVQRWEREIDFPVHRAGDDTRRVIGYTDEINDWMRRAQTASAPKANVHVSIETRQEQLTKLRSQVLRAREQAAILRDTVAKLKSHSTIRAVDNEELAVMEPGES